MRKELLDRLSEITEEEQAILRGEPLDMSRYNHAGKNQMDPGTLLPGGELFGIRMHTRFSAFPRHGHNYVEMIYQVQGQTTHVIDGEETLTLTAGKLLLLGRETEHSIEAAGKEDLAVNFFLIPAFFDNAAISLGDSNALSVFLQRNLDHQRGSGGHLLYDVSGSIAAENLLENLVAGQLEGASMQLQQLTLELLLRHLSGLSEKLVIRTRQDRERAVVLKVLSLIERHVQLNLTELARQMGMGVPALSRMIHSQTGCTFTELMHTARFNRAAVLLRDTNLSVTDIACAVGYENTAFFYRRFAQRYGCTPAAYRKQRQRTEESQNRI